MRASETSAWVEGTATVTSCRYQFARLNTLTLGIGTGERFRIEFAYEVRGTRYAGEFQSPRAIAQGERLPVRYDPRNPGQNSLAGGSEAAGRGAVVAIGIAGSVVLSLVWLALLRGCG